MYIVRVNTIILLNYLENKNPVDWNKQQVAEWISSVCDELDITDNVDELSSLKNQNGKGLNLLLKEDWIRRCPNHGDLFYIQWEKMKQEYMTETKDRGIKVETESGR